MATDAGQYFDVAKAVLGPVFHFLWRVEVEGLENVPVTGPAIIAPNHVSVLDSFFVPLALPRRITYVGKAEYMDSWKTKYLFPAMGMIPIDRAGGDASKGALDAAAGVLGRGELFGIYPEGTRSRSGKLHKGHTGVARLALRCRCPIVPVGLQGTVEVMPPDARLPEVFRHVRVRFGRPVDVTRYLDRLDDRLVLRQITDEVMYEIRELSGQEYVNDYATKRSEVLPSPTAQLSTEGQVPHGDPGPSGNGSGPPRTAAEALKAAQGA
ncbi:MAG: 1-acyl-sn-glycerol-3-phosphate acyltransferase [Acidimicrobiales bacterium]|nr:1-acyl-sn-glycerol-3-phosphate acyltransferase [Acidimicrobiales bacterium]